MTAPITPEMLAAARDLFAGRISDCAHCGGWSKHDPRRSPARFDAKLCAPSVPAGTWQIRCYSCSACVTSFDTAADAVERWNRRPAGAGERPVELLPLVDLQSIANGFDTPLTSRLEEFARNVQAAVLRLNSRPRQ